MRLAAPFKSLEAIAEIDRRCPVWAGFRSARTSRAQGAYVPDIIVLLTDGITIPASALDAQQAVDRGVRVTIGSAQITSHPSRYVPAARRRPDNNYPAHIMPDMDSMERGWISQGH
jgi:hypothetical protein